MLPSPVMGAWLHLTMYSPHRFTNRIQMIAWRILYTSLRLIQYTRYLHTIHLISASERNSQMIFWYFILIWQKRQRPWQVPLRFEKKSSRGFTSFVLLDKYYFLMVFAGNNVYSSQSILVKSHKLFFQASREPFMTSIFPVIKIRYKKHCVCALFSF
jgi:hypothetical protein